MADLLTADSASVSEKTSNPVYGIFLIDDDGAPQSIFTEDAMPDSFIGYSYSNDSKLSQYPQEAGGFQQYNKVDTPFDLRVTLTKGGKTSQVSSFIRITQALAKATDLNLYAVITPEFTYNAVNVGKVSHDHKRDHGANMATVEIYFTEIRVSGAAQYTNTGVPPITASKTAAGQSAQSAGTVQPQFSSDADTNSVIISIQQAEAAQNHGSH